MFGVLPSTPAKYLNDDDRFMKVDTPLSVVGENKDQMNKENEQPNLDMSKFRQIFSSNRKAMRPKTDNIISTTNKTMAFTGAGNTTLRFGGRNASFLDQTMTINNGSQGFNLPVRKGPQHSSLQKLY